MGMLLRFEPKPSRAGQIGPEARLEGAKVLFFTGVRYDRSQDGEAVKLSPAKPRARRSKVKQ